MLRFAARARLGAEASQLRLGIWNSTGTGEECRPGMSIV